MKNVKNNGKIFLFLKFNIFDRFVHRDKSYKQLDLIKTRNLNLNPNFNLNPNVNLNLNLQP